MPTDYNEITLDRVDKIKSLLRQAKIAAMRLPDEWYCRVGDDFCDKLTEASLLLETLGADIEPHAAAL